MWEISSKTNLMGKGLKPRKKNERTVLLQLLYQENFLKMSILKDEPQYQLF